MSSDESDRDYPSLDSDDDEEMMVEADEFVRFQSAWRLVIQRDHDRCARALCRVLVRVENEGDMETLTNGEVLALLHALTHRFQKLKESDRIRRQYVIQVFDQNMEQLQDEYDDAIMQFRRLIHARLNERHRAFNHGRNARRAGTFIVRYETTVNAESGELDFEVVQWNRENEDEE